MTTGIYEEAREQAIARLRAGVDEAKERIASEYAIRGMSSEDTNRCNKEVRKLFTAVGLPVTRSDLHPDLCREAEELLENMYTQDVVRINEWYTKLEQSKTPLKGIENVEG